MFNFLMKKMIQNQIKNLPAEQQTKILTAFDKNPELFKKIAEEVKVASKNGNNSQMAAMNVMSKYKKELQELMK
jgi:predicted house-cleaning noncanonical NTP pyrophosphatase (MazG superfamily)